MGKVKELWAIRNLRRRFTVWPLIRKLPRDLTAEIEEYLPLKSPCWPQLERGPTPSAFCIKRLKNQLTAFRLLDENEEYWTNDD